MVYSQISWSRSSVRSRNGTSSNGFLRWCVAVRGTSDRSDPSDGWGEGRREATLDLEQFERPFGASALGYLESGFLSSIDPTKEVELPSFFVSHPPSSPTMFCFSFFRRLGTPCRPPDLAHDGALGRRPALLARLQS